MTETPTATPTIEAIVDHANVMLITYLAMSLLMLMTLGGAYGIKKFKELP